MVHVLKIMGHCLKSWYGPGRELLKQKHVVVINPLSPPSKKLKVAFEVSTTLGDVHLPPKIESWIPGKTGDLLHHMLPDVLA